MQRLSSTAVVARASALCVGAALLIAGRAVATPACVTVTGHAIYRNYGYDHVVHVANGCDRAASCEVSTDVNPEPEHVSVPANGDVDVLTFRGSPARAFTPRVECKLAPACTTGAARGGRAGPHA